VRPAGRGCGFRQRAHEQRVPLAEHLVVETRPHPLLARLEERLAGPVDRLRAQEVAAYRSMEDGGALEVASGRDAPPLGGRGGIGPEDLLDLLDAPDVEPALLTLGVGVLGR